MVLFYRFLLFLQANSHERQVVLPVLQRLAQLAWPSTQYLHTDTVSK